MKVRFYLRGKRKCLAIGVYRVSVSTKMGEVAKLCSNICRIAGEWLKASSDNQCSSGLAGA